MKLHALDISSSVGSAVMERGRVPLFQTLRLHGDQVEMGGRLLVWLEEMHMVHRFDAIAWEQPLFVPKRDTVAKLEMLIGLAGVVTGFAGKHKLPWCKVTVQEAKQALTGRANADKDDMVAAAVSTFGWKVATDHEADAGGVGIHAMGILNPRRVAA